MDSPTTPVPRSTTVVLVRAENEGDPVEVPASPEEVHDGEAHAPSDDA